MCFGWQMNHVPAACMRVFYCACVHTTCFFLFCLENILCNHYWASRIKNNNHSYGCGWSERHYVRVCVCLCCPCVRTSSDKNNESNWGVETCHPHRKWKQPQIVVLPLISVFGGRFDWRHSIAHAAAAAAAVRSFVFGHRRLSTKARASAASCKLVGRLLD